MSSRDVVPMPTGLSSKGCLKIPSFFFVLTLKLPGVRIPIPVVIPLFVLEDLVESAAIASYTLGFLHPSLRRKMQCSTIRYKGFSGWNGELDIKAVLDATSELIRQLRSCGRFTLLEVSAGSEGVGVTVRLV
ncbi:MAG: hypothetical protein GX795_02755 [Firmicutes bacterium]|nr:hypothetical protein [Bacillota bacterium]